MLERLTQLKIHLFDLLYPEKCLSCGSPGRYICANCLSRCKPAEKDTGAHTAIFSYEDSAIRRAVWLLKYRNRKNIAAIFGEALAEWFLEESADRALFGTSGQTIVVPIPLSKKRERSRGYNQASLIAKEFARRAHLPLLDHVLVKVRDTPPQVGLSRTARRKNLQNAFAVSEAAAVARKDILLVDDVTTTGTTLEEATRTLKKAGVRGVTAVVIAR